MVELSLKLPFSALVASAASRGIVGRQNRARLGRALRGRSPPAPRVAPPARRADSPLDFPPSWQLTPIGRGAAPACTERQKPPCGHPPRHSRFSRAAPQGAQGLPPESSATRPPRPWPHNRQHRSIASFDRRSAPMSRVRWYNLALMLMLIPRPSSAIQLQWSSGSSDLAFTSATRCTLVLQ